MNKNNKEATFKKVVVLAISLMLAFPGIGYGEEPTFHELLDDPDNFARQITEAEVQEFKSLIENAHWYGEDLEIQRFRWLGAETGETHQIMVATTYLWFQSPCNIYISGDEYFNNWGDADETFIIMDKYGNSYETEPEIVEIVINDGVYLENKAFDFDMSLEEFINENPFDWEMLIYDDHVEPPELGGDGNVIIEDLPRQWTEIGYGDYEELNSLFEAPGSGEENGTEDKSEAETEGLQVELTGTVEPLVIDIEFSKTELNLDIEQGQVRGEDEFEIINHTQAPIQVYAEDFTHEGEYIIDSFPSVGWEDMDIIDSSKTLGFEFGFDTSSTHQSTKYFRPNMLANNLLWETAPGNGVEGLFFTGEIPEGDSVNASAASHAGLRRPAILEVSGSFDWIVSLDELK